MFELNEMSLYVRRLRIKRSIVLGIYVSVQMHFYHFHRKATKTITSSPFQTVTRHHEKLQNHQKEVSIIRLHY